MSATRELLLRGAACVRPPLLRLRVRALSTAASPPPESSSSSNGEPPSGLADRVVARLNGAIQRHPAETLAVLFASDIGSIGAMYGVLTLTGATRASLANARRTHQATHCMRQAPSSRPSSRSRSPPAARSGASACRSTWQRPRRSPRPSRRSRACGCLSSPARCRGVYCMMHLML